MKKYYFLILFIGITFCNSLYSQWAPVGAKWYYNRPNSTNGDYVFFESKKDSIIQGKNIQIIEVKINGVYPVSKEYIYQKNDSVYYYNSNYNAFFLLYDFSAKAGDTITVHSSKFKPTKAFFSYYDSIPNFKYKVLSIDSIELSGQWVKRQKVITLKNDLWGFSRADGNDYYILNKIGSLAYFFGIQTGITPEDILPLCRCYKDFKIEFYNPLWVNSCDLISSIQKKDITYNEMIYPNPFTDQLVITAGELIGTIEIIDAKGLKLFAVQQNLNSVVLNTSFLFNGFYLLRIITNKHIYCKKILKISSL